MLHSAGYQVNVSGKGTPSNVDINRVKSFYENLIVGIANDLGYLRELTIDDRLLVLVERLRLGLSLLTGHDASSRGVNILPEVKDAEMAISNWITVLRNDACSNMVLKEQLKSIGKRKQRLILGKGSHGTKSRTRQDSGSETEYSDEEDNRGNGEGKDNRFMNDGKEPPNVPLDDIHHTADLDVVPQTATLNKGKGSIDEGFGEGSTDEDLGEQPKQEDEGNRTGYASETDSEDSDADTLPPGSTDLSADEDYLDEDLRRVTREAQAELDDCYDPGPLNLDILSSKLPMLVERETVERGPVEPIGPIGPHDIDDSIHIESNAVRHDSTNYCIAGMVCSGLCTPGTCISGDCNSKLSTVGDIITYQTYSTH